MDKKALYNLSYGLFVLTVCENGKDNGCIINTAIQVSSSPNNMCISVNKANYTHDVLLRTHEYNVSVIAENATFDLFQRFGFHSGKEVNKL